MISGVKSIVGHFLIIVLLVASVTFAGLSRLQSTQQDDPIKGGLIRSDVTIQELDNYIQQLPDTQTQVTATTGTSFAPNQTQNEETNTKQDTEDQNTQDNETGSTTINNEASQNNIDELLEDVLSKQDNYHPIAEDYNNKLQQLCITYRSICTITQLEGDYSSQQLYAYQVMVIFITQKLSNRGYNPLTSLRSLTINNYTKNKRGYANARLVVLNTYQMKDYKEFLQVLVHEIGHVIDLGVIVGNSRQINSDYTEFGKAKFAIDDQSLAFYAISRLNEDTMRANMSNTDFVSGYATTNPFEDFAESHNMYLYHREVFAYLASNNRALQQKYDYFNQLYQSNYLSANFNPTDLTQLDITMRAWDTTRM